MRAHGIFEGKGLLKLLKEVKSKLKMLNSSVKLAAEMAAAEGIESGDDSGRDGSPDKKSPSAEKGKAAGLKKKKGPLGGALAKKKVKKTVFRNNFVKESDSAQQL